MQTIDRGIKLRFGVLIVLLLFVLPVCIYLYGRRSNDYLLSRPEASYGAQLTNPLILQTWLPKQSIDYTVARLNDYMSTANPNAPNNAIEVIGGVNIYSGTYSFQVEFLPTNVIHQVSVRVINYSSVLSTAVYVDNNLQRPVIPSTYRGISFTGLDNLQNTGLSVMQVRAFETAVQKFLPSSNSVRVNNTSLSNKTNPNYQQFISQIDVGKDSFSANIKAFTDDSISLNLKNRAGQIVFDSGNIRSE